jgi:hypothetical protein
MNFKHVFKTLLPAMALLFLAKEASAGTATNIWGLYYTGVNDTYGLLSSGGTQDSHWAVTYASTNGGSSANTAYEGQGYVVSPSNVSSVAWIQNTSSAQWITAPGATDSAGNNVNKGNDYLPGTGTGMGTHEGVYDYSLSFNVAGTGSGNVGNNVSISLTVAADDQYSIYVNPVLNGDGSVNKSSSTLAFSATAAWNNTQVATLANFGGSNNSSFVIGTNKIVIEVDNTNSKTGNVADSINASGLMVYQVGAVAMINGNPVPEVGAWLPVAFAVGLFGWRRWRSKEASDVSIA